MNPKKCSTVIIMILLFGALSHTGFGQIPVISPLVGDYKTSAGNFYLKVYTTPDGGFKANLVTDPISRNPPVAVLTGEKVSDAVVNLSGDGWTGKIEKEKVSLVKEGQKLAMQHYFRTSPTLNAAPPKDAIVLFDGKNLDAWKKVLEKDWLEGTSPADNFKILSDGSLQVVPHPAGAFESMITKQKFGDLKLHVEFRLQGEVTNGGVYLMSRYEVNIKDAYGILTGDPIAFGNIAKPAEKPNVNAAFPPMQWQTLDIDWRAPRFDASGKIKTENPRITVVHNGVTIYKDVEIEEVKGSTGKLGEAAVGPIYLQEHGNAYQFRNIWVVDKTLKGTESFQTAAAAVDTASTGGGKGKGGNKAGGKGKGGGGKKYGTGRKLSAADSALLASQPAVKKKGGSSNKNKDANYDGEKNPAYAAVTVMLTADASGKPAPSAGFIHPGILVNGSQLAEIKRRVAAGIEPQKSAFAALKASPYGAIDYVVQPRDTVSCGPYSKPNLGCKEEQNDCAAAYTQALLWAITGNKAYAENSIKIMNAWATHLVGGHNYANGPVQAAWCGSVWPRAAEIIRYTYKGWPDADIAKFQNMLRTQFLPTIIHGDCENGNKELAMSEALINIGVFNDDRTVYDLGVKMWRGRTPAYIYLKTDGATPVAAPGCPAPAIWGNKGFTPEFVDGLLQESARDSHHPWMAYASMADAAETARQQGLDLYGEEGKRMMAALEYEAQYLKPNNTPVPANMEFGLQPTWEIAYNHFHDRMGYKLPKMAAVLPTNRPTVGDHHMLWETLTHAGMGSVGLPPLKK